MPFQPPGDNRRGFGWALKTAITQGAKRGLFSKRGPAWAPRRTRHAQANVKDPA